MISPSSYINPYVEMEKKRIEAIAPTKLNNLSPKWTHKTNISLIEVAFLRCRKGKSWERVTSVLSQIDIISTIMKRLREIVPGSG